MNSKIHFLLNGEQTEISVPVHWTILKALRETLGLTGTKEGCSTGDCGACTILVNNKPVNSCLTLAAEVEGYDIWTIEGLSKLPLMKKIQKSFIDHEAFQCGFCTSGILVTIYGLLLEKKNPSEQEMSSALAGNLCRCTGYNRIIDIVKDLGVD